jgi:hypothetical protein
MNKTKKARFSRAGAFAGTCLIALHVSTQPVAASEVVTVNITVMPFATLEFDDPDPLLYLEVPPPGSTIPATGVAFTVIGNANATLSAEPDAFMQVPAAQYVGAAFDPWLGQATQSGQEIAYDIELRFPIGPCIVGLPLDQQGPAVSPLVNVAGAGGTVAGVIHLIAHQNWTE